VAKYKDRKAKEIRDLGDKLHTKKKPLDNLNQEIACEFCPDLATFTGEEMAPGKDFMVDQMDSTPIMISREVSNQLAAQLRPQDQFWFRSTTMDDYKDADEENAQGLEYLTRTTWRGIYNPKSQMVAGTKEADRFYVNFGMAVLGVNEAPGTRDHLFFKNFHIKDCSWLENDIGVVDHLHRREKMTARAMNRRWGGSQYNLHQSVREAATKEPDREFEIRVVTMPADEYDDFTMDAKAPRGKRNENMPFVICYIDCDNGVVIRDAGLVAFNYVVPRWHRFVGSQYAFSPASLTALPDARMAQMLAQILLDAGEKAVDPPLVGKQEIVIGDPSLMAGAITWVDIEHDGKLSEAIEALKIDPDMRVGLEMRKDVRDMLARAFYLDKLAMPPTGDRTTAFEIARQLEMHARSLVPLFEPMQIEYNTVLLDTSFAFMDNMKMIDWSMVPGKLGGSDFAWAFESPIQQARYRMMVEQFRDTMQIVAAAKEMGYMASPVKIDVAVRDAVRGVGGPATWRKTVDEQQQEEQENEQKQQMQEAMVAAHQAGQIASQAGDAGQKLGLIPPGGPMMPSVDQAVPADNGVPQNTAATGSPTPGNAARALNEMMAQLGGGAPAASQPSPGAPPAVATPQGTTQDVVLMQRQILRKLSELDAAMKETRQIRIERDSKGKVKSAHTVTGGQNAGRQLARLPGAANAPAANAGKAQQPRRNSINAAAR
jgi:hypothetical protein